MNCTPSPDSASPAQRDDGPNQLAAAMEATGYDAETVARHLPVFNRKWSEIRKEKWAQIFVMERPGCGRKGVIKVPCLPEFT